MVTQFESTLHGVLMSAETEITHFVQYYEVNDI